MTFRRNALWTKCPLDEMSFRRNGFRRNVMDSLGPPGFNWCFFSFAPKISKLFGAQGSPSQGSPSSCSLLNPRFCLFDLFVLDDSLTS